MRLVHVIHSLALLAGPLVLTVDLHAQRIQGIGAGPRTPMAHRLLDRPPSDMLRAQPGRAPSNDQGTDRDACRRAKLGAALVGGALGGVAGYYLTGLLTIPVAALEGEEAHARLARRGAAVGAVLGGGLGWSGAARRPPCRWSVLGAGRPRAATVGAA